MEKKNKESSTLGVIYYFSLDKIISFTTKNQTLTYNSLRIFRMTDSEHRNKKLARKTINYYLIYRLTEQQFSHPNFYIRLDIEDLESIPVQKSFSH